MTLKSQFLKELDACLVLANFRRTSDQFYGENYYRVCGSVRQCIHLGIVARGRAIEVDIPYVSVRFDAVEDLCASLEAPNPLIGEADIAMRATLTQPISLRRLWRKTWTVRETDLKAPIAEQVARYALREGAPAFDLLSDPVEALRLLCGDDEHSRSLSGPNDVRARKAVALAFTLKGTTAARDVANAKMAVLRGQARSVFEVWMAKFVQGFGT
jgi:hypothetical protein